MNDSIPAIRILPMVIGEFEGAPDYKVQSDYFRVDLPLLKGLYKYRKQGVVAEPGTIVLFQYDKKIIASAVFISREQFDQPKEGYHGTLKFDVQSIKVFEPVGPEVLANLWPEKFKRFSNVMTQLNADAYPEFVRQLKGIRPPMPILDDLDQSFENEVSEASQRTPEQRESRNKKASRKPKRITVITTAFDRNPDVVAQVLVRANGTCEQCKCPAPFVRRSDGSPYLEVHHIKPLADDGEDTVENATALCPNCHREAHYA